MQSGSSCLSVSISLKILEGENLNLKWYTPDRALVRFTYDQYYKMAIVRGGFVVVVNSFLAVKHHLLEVKKAE